MLADNIQDLMIEDIREERRKQHIQWGGPNHDDTHNLSDWVEFIDKQCRLSLSNPGLFRERMIKVDAIAIAAIESSDRKRKVARKGLA